MSKPVIQSSHSGRYSFVLALWVAMLTAVVSAIAPSGLPSTRTVGSAFDPSTTAVVLKARSPLRAMVVLERRGDDRADLPRLPGDGATPALLAVTPGFIVPALFAVATWAPVAIDHPRASQLRYIIQPRAPPAA